MKLSKVTEIALVVAFVLPSIRIIRLVKAHPTELLDTGNDTTVRKNSSWQLGQLLEKIDKIEEIDAHRREEALENLQKMFGIRSQNEKNSTHHKTPPQFMMELYKTIADPSGVTRGKNPYNAKIVRSFIERDSGLSHLYLFNITGLEINESVLEAELHLYRKRTSPKIIHPTILSSPYYLIKVYQVLQGKRMDEPDLHRLLNVHYVGAHASGWQVFNVKQAVLAWVASAPNLGLIVTASTLFGDDVTIEFSRRNEYHHSKQPILVLFDDDDDGKSRTASDNIASHYYAYDNEPEELEPRTIVDEDIAKGIFDSPEDSATRDNLHRLKRHQEDMAKIQEKSRSNKEQSYRLSTVLDTTSGTQLRSSRITGTTEYLQRHKRLGRRRISGGKTDSVIIQETAKSSENSLRPRRAAIERTAKEKFVSERKARASRILASMDIYERAMLREQASVRDPRFDDVEKSRRRDSRKKRSAKVAEIVEESSKSHANTRGNATECSRHELYVDFKEIGLSSSIIAPKGYSAYHCQGPCNSPLSQEQQPTNHATVQGIVHKMGLVDDVRMPCCVPTKLLSTSILFFDDNENVVLKVYEDMIADRCGCR